MVRTPAPGPDQCAVRVPRERFSLNRLSNLAIKADPVDSTTVGAGGVVLLYADSGVGVSGAVRQGLATVEGDFDPGTQFGHLIVEKDGRPCFCGRRGCLEQYAGVTPLDAAVGGDLRRHDEHHLDTLLASGDPEVVAAARGQAQWLARAIDTLAVALGVGEFVLGGVFGRLFPIIEADLKAELDRLGALPGGPAPTVRAAADAVDGVVHGAINEAVAMIVQNPGARGVRAG